jgi:cation transport ATPase
MKQNTYRIISSSGVTIVASGVNIYYTVQRNSIDYQAHPVASFVGSIIPGVIAGFAFYWLSGWRARRKQEKLKHVGSDKFYDEVAREMQGKPLIAGLWAKAFAEMGGDDAKARALYIKYRVAQLVEASRQRVEQDRIERQRQEKQQRAAKEAAKRQARTKFHRFIYWILGFASGLLTLFFGFLGVAFITVAFTRDSGDSDDFAIAVPFLLIAFCLGSATILCYKETRNHHTKKFTLWLGSNNIGFTFRRCFQA